MSNSTYIHIDSEDCLEKLTQSIKEQIRCIDKAYDEICIACIGTDRATGDCLGPLVGMKISGLQGIRVRGTLENPLHGMNIVEFVNSLSSNQLVIAVDSCLGRFENIGHIAVESGPLKPGAGVDKQLPAIGDINIKGIVNIAGFMEQIVVQTTRLNLVMKMADIIADGLQVALST